MLRFLLKRAGAMVVVVLAVATVTWAMLHLLYPEPWAFDTRPLPVQYLTYMWDLVRLDLGSSWDIRGGEVATVIADGIGADLFLLAGGMGVGIAGGLVAGTFAGARPRSAFARLLDGAAALLLVAPVYWVGLMLLLAFSAGSGLLVALPFVGTGVVYESPWVDPLRFLQALWLPWLVLGAPLGAMVYRMTRATIGETLDQDFLRTARAKGLAEHQVLGRHALPAAATPVMTLVGTQMAILMTNLVLVEIVFSVPGIYSDVERATQQGNLPLLQGLTVVTGVLVVLATLVVDVLQAWLDPTVREA